MTSKGWRRESKRHSLAARGVKTVKVSRIKPILNTDEAREREDELKGRRLFFSTFFSMWKQGMLSRQEKMDLLKGVFSVKEIPKPHLERILDNYAVLSDTDAIKLEGLAERHNHTVQRVMQYI